MQRHRPGTQTIDGLERITNTHTPSHLTQCIRTRGVLNAIQRCNVSQCRDQYFRGAAKQVIFQLQVLFTSNLVECRCVVQFATALCNM